MAYLYIWSSITAAIVSWCILYSFNWTADLGVQRSEIWQNEDPSFSLDVDKMPMKDPPKQRSLRGNIYSLDGFPWFCMVSHGFPWFPMVSHGFPWFQPRNIEFYIVFLYVFFGHFAFIPWEIQENDWERPSDNAQTQLVLRKRRDRTLQGEDFIGDFLPWISIHFWFFCLVRILQNV